MNLLDARKHIEEQQRFWRKIESIRAELVFNNFATDKEGTTDSFAFGPTHTFKVTWDKSKWSACVDAYIGYEKVRYIFGLKDSSKTAIDTEGWSLPPEFVRFMTSMLTGCDNESTSKSS